MKLFLEAIVFGIFALGSTACACIAVWEGNLIIASLCTFTSLVNIYLTLVAVDDGIRNRWRMK